MALSGTDFWDQFLSLLEGGQRTSNVQFYLPNQGSGTTAEAGEWGNVIEQLFDRTTTGSPERIQAVEMLADVGFWAPGDKLDFWINGDLKPEDIANLAAAAEERLPVLFDKDGASTNPGGGQQATGSPKGVMEGGDLEHVTRLGIRLPSAPRRAPIAFVSRPFVICRPVWSMSCAATLSAPSVRGARNTRSRHGRTSICCSRPG